MGKMRNAYRASIGKPEGKRPLERSGHKRKDIKVKLREMGYEDMDRDQGRTFENTVMNHRDP
jgi:hypothetical protein